MKYGKVKKFIIAAIATVLVAFGLVVIHYQQQKNIKQPEVIETTPLVKDTQMQKMVHYTKSDGQSVDMVVDMQQTPDGWKIVSTKVLGVSQ